MRTPLSPRILPRTTPAPEEVPEFDGSLVGTKLAVAVVSRVWRLLVAFLEVFALSRGTWPGVLSLGSSPAAKTVADTITQAQVWFIHGMFGPWTMVRLCRSSGIFP